MNLDSWTLFASLALPGAFPQDGIADRSPAPRVLDVDAALPIRMSGSALELRVKLTHAWLGAKYARLSSEVAGGALELNPTPRAHSAAATAAGCEWLSCSPRIRAGLTAKLLPLRNISGALSALPITALTPSINEVAFAGAEHLRFPAGCLVFRAALLAARHEPSIARGFEISPEYCAIARRRLAEIDAQPSLFEPKPEQLTIGGAE